MSSFIRSESSHAYVHTNSDNNFPETSQVLSNPRFESDSPRRTRRSHPRSHSRSFSWSCPTFCVDNNNDSMALFSPIRVIQTLTNTVNSSPRIPSSPTRTHVDNSRVSNSSSSSHVRTRSDASRGHSSSVEIDIEDSPSASMQSESTPVDNNATDTASRPQDQMEFLGTISWLEKAIPFIVLLLTRIMWDHRLGILVFIGMFGTYFHVNSTIKKQVALKERRLNRISLGIFLFLFANIFFIYYVFKNQKLENCLIFQKPNLRLVEVWAVFWCVGITDFVIRYVAMALKCFVIVLPRRLVNFRKRGKYFLIIEHVTQFYRMTTPIFPWYIYFSNYGFGGEYFAVLSTSLYLLLKGRMLFKKLKEVKTAFLCYWKDTVQSVTIAKQNSKVLNKRYGRSPSKELLLEAGDSCPICQETMEDPIELNQCKHIFCEECIVMWFDRERTCPMCRAKIAEDPLWRDGNTQLFMQIY